MQPRRSTRPSVSKSSCTIAHHPTENGEAEPQSMERKRIHSLGTSNGLMTCRPLSQQSKNAPKATRLHAKDQGARLSCIWRALYDGRRERGLNVLICPTKPNASL